MELENAIKILENHNLWRKGGDTEMVNVRALGEAIDVIVNHYKNCPCALIQKNHS